LPPVREMTLISYRESGDSKGQLLRSQANEPQRRAEAK
jgi:hypothetical protein